MLDLAHEIAQTLSNNKLRTALTGFAVAWGIFMLIVLLSLAQGVLNSAQKDQDPAANNVVNLYSGRTTMAYRGYEPGRAIDLNDRDLLPLADENRQYIKQAMGTCSLNGITLTGTSGQVAGIEGINPDNQTSIKLNIIAGRPLNAADQQHARRSLLIAERSVAVLFGDKVTPDQAVGKILSGAGLGWQIVGVYQHPWRENAYAPFATAIALGGYDGNLNYITAQLADDINPTTAADANQALRATMARRHEFDPDDQSAVWISNRYQQYQNMQQVNNILHGALWAIGLLTMLSGIVGVSNIMFVSVRERSHEIGIRRAIGAKPRNILWQVIAEAIAITSIFGYIGMLVGMALMAIVGQVTQGLPWLLNPQIDIKIAIAVLVVLVIAGTLAGLFPALKATKVKPIEALREE